MAELCDLTAADLASKLRAGETSSTEVTESCLARVEAVDERVRAFLARTPELARAWWETHQPVPS